MIFPPGLPLIHGPEYTDRLADWAVARIPHVGAHGFGPCWAVGVARDGALAASVVYHDWQPHIGLVQISIASDTPRWASRQVIAALLAVPFLGKLDPNAPACRKVVVVCASTNERAIKAAQRIGFTQEATLAHHFAQKVHAVVLRMFARDFARKYGGLA